MTVPHVTSVRVTSQHRASSCPCAPAPGEGRCFGSKFGVCGSPPSFGDSAQAVAFCGPPVSLASSELAVSKGVGGIWAKELVQGDAVGLGGGCR